MIPRVGQACGGRWRRLSFLYNVATGQLYVAAGGGGGARKLRNTKADKRMHGNDAEWGQDSTDSIRESTFGGVGGFGGYSSRAAGGAGWFSKGIPKNFRVRHE